VTFASFTVAAVYLHVVMAI